MVTVNEAIDWARAWEGYRDNAGAKVWKQYAPVDYTGSSFCGAGQGMICKALGLDLAPTTHQRIIYVPYVVQDARAAGKWILSKDSKPGDWVIFAWGNGYHDIAASNADHIGMIVHNDPSRSTVTTFEFNTTDGNGNGPRGAFLRTRSRSDIMGCVDRQHAYTKAPTVPIKPAPMPNAHAPLKVDGYLGKATITRWQQVMGTTADGRITPGGSQLVEAVQRFLNAKGARDEHGHRLVVDGVCDLDNTAHATPRQHTIAALERHLHTTIDAYLSSPSSCVEALQRALNKAKTASKEF